MSTQVQNEIIETKEESQARNRNYKHIYIYNAIKYIIQ